MTWRAMALASLLVVPSPSSYLSAATLLETPPNLAHILARQPSKAEIIESNSPAALRERTRGQERLRLSGSPGPADALWSSGFGLPSIDGHLNCVIHFGNDIVVGGSFTQISGIPLNNIARWDGESWHPLGGGQDQEVTALAVYRGDLYAGGRSQYTGSGYAPALAKWDGSGWTPVKGSAPSSFCCNIITSLAVYRDELIAAGAFPDSSSEGYRALSNWNGSSWGTLGGDVHGLAGSLLAQGDSLFVAGVFPPSGPMATQGVLMWDGSQWSAVGEGTSTPYGWGGVDAMAFYRDRLFAAGVFDSIGGNAISGLAAWDGTSWSAVGDFDGTYGVSSLTIHNDALVAAAYGTLARWDGSTWTYNPSVLDGGIAGLLSDAGDLIAVGGFSVRDSTGSPIGFGIGRWDGRTWFGYESWSPDMKGLANWNGGPAYVQCLGTYQGNLIAGGFISYAGDGTRYVPAERISRWDGVSWEPMASPYSGYTIPYAFLSHADTLYAAGLFQDPGALTLVPVVRWESDHWTPLDTLFATGACLSWYQGHLVVGTNSDYFGATRSGVYEWTGSQWRNLGEVSGVQYGGITALTVYNGQLVAAGGFRSIGGVPADGIASWDGVSWRALGDTPHSGYFGGVQLASYGGLLYAGGGFFLPGRNAPLVAWDGTSWSVIDGISGVIRVMAVVGARLVVGGDLRLGDSPERVTLAALVSHHWRSLGSGVNGEVTSLLEYNGALYVGGGFSSAGGKGSYGIARWNEFNSAPPVPLSLAPGHPNPFVGSTDLSYRVERDSSIRILVHDVHGRVVTTLDIGHKPAGNYSVRWDGRDRLGNLASSGIYFVTIRDQSGATASRKIVRLR
jgi:trimeric autotransporter adhesin